MLQKQLIKSEVEDCVTMIRNHRQGLVMVDNEVMLLMLLKKLEFLSRELNRLDREKLPDIE